MNTTLHGDATFDDEEHVDEEIEMKAKDVEAELIEVIAETNARVDVLSIQIVP